MDKVSQYFEDRNMDGLALFSCEMQLGFSFKKFFFNNREVASRVIEAAVSRCSSKQVSLKISQYSQACTCVGVFV